jgi:hypothetical protein
MKYEIHNPQGVVGTAEWRAPGDVALEMPDPVARDWFERFFADEDSYLDGPVEAAGMEAARRDASEAAFEHATYRLAAYAYTVKRGDGRRAEAH